jgi:hypothetical protein
MMHQLLCWGAIKISLETALHPGQMSIWNMCCDAGLFMSPVTSAYNHQSKLKVFTLVMYIAFDTLWLTSVSLTMISRCFIPDAYI